MRRYERGTELTAHSLRTLATRAALGAAGIGALLIAPPAIGHQADPRPVSPAAAEAALGAGADRLDGGLYRVEPARGAALLTHGPDAAADYLPSLRRAAPGRDAVCADEWHTQVLVARPAGAPDRAGVVAPLVRESIRRANGVLASAAVSSGGPAADLRVACDAAGQISIGSFVASSPAFADVVAGARAAGFARDTANYAIFFDAPADGGFCGMGSYAVDDRPIAANRNNDGGAYAVTYQPCWDSLAVLHEIAHNQGAVQPEAPNSTGSGGHCNQLLDVVCVVPDGGDRNQVVSLACPVDVQLDCGGDDYFDTAPEPEEYLASHWNMGSSLNRFLALGGAPLAAPPCAARACATPLSLGVPIAGSVGPGETALYRLGLRRDRPRLRVALAATAGLELRLRRGALPRAGGRGCTGGVCRIARPKRGRWFASVSLPDGAAASEFEITASAR